MSDIVQLKENGVGKFMMTHAQGVVGLKEIVNTKRELVTLKTGFTNYDTTEANKLTLITHGGIALLTGIIKNSSEIAAGATAVFATIPSNYEILNSGNSTSTASYNNRFLIVVSNDRSCSIMRHSANGDNLKINAGSWLNINVFFGIEQLNSAER